MTEPSATNESDSAAQAALKAPFQRAVADMKAWGGPLKKATGVDASAAHNPVDLAHQIYRECLLSKLSAIG